MQKGICADCGKKIDCQMDYFLCLSCYVRMVQTMDIQTPNINEDSPLRKKYLAAPPITESEDNFIRESNRIEGIIRNTLPHEIKEFRRFMALSTVSISDLKNYVKIHQPNAVIRNKAGLNVRVDNHYPPEGGKHIIPALKKILEDANKYKENSPVQIGISSDEVAYNVHLAYETLHPFTDGNGRSGRMLWWWMTGGSGLGFLHKWYYQSLEYTRKP